MSTVPPCSPPRDFLSWYGSWLEGLLTGADWYAEMLGEANPFRAEGSSAGPDQQRSAVCPVSNRLLVSSVFC